MAGPTGTQLHQLLEYLAQKEPAAVTSTQITEGLGWEWSTAEKLLRYARGEGLVHSGLSGSKLTDKGRERYSSWSESDNQITIEG